MKNLKDKLSKLEEQVKECFDGDDDVRECQHCKKFFSCEDGIRNWISK